MAAGDRRYLFVDRDKGSSVYSAVGKYLENRGDWKRQPPDSPRFNLMLGDRNRIPWHVFGQVPQVVNYYRGSEALCRKTSMTRIFRDHSKKTKERPFAWLPQSFILTPHIPMSCSSDDLRSTVSCTSLGRNDDRDQLQEYVKQSTPGESGLWIVKSSAGSKGDGIKISRNIKELLNYVDSQTKAFVCQQYIHPPLLLTHERKFDIRCWVLIDLFYNVYLYREGVLRTASDPYTSDVGNITAHLTNHSLQKQLSHNFGQYEEGNEMFFADFDRYLLCTHRVSLESKILPQIRAIVRTCFSIIQEQINTGTATYWSFQLFGLDFMVDEQFKVWLIEINGAPACASKLLPGMVPCIVELAIDPAFPPRVPVTYKENLFEKL